MTQPPGGYLDAASGAPLHPVAREALLAALQDGWADPGRLYGEARRARLLLETSREAMAEAIGARTPEVDFAANGTQALHVAVLGALAGNRRAPTVVHTAVEHSAVLHALDGTPAVSVPVDPVGRVDRDAFERAVRAPGVAAGAVQAANQEVGTTQPVDDIDSPVPLIVDATHALGHVELPRRWSVLAADARMWGGPSVGVLAVRPGVRWRPPLPQDDRGRVPGVPDLPAVVAATASLRAVLTERDELAARHRVLTDRIRAAATTLPGVTVLGDPRDCLPHLVTLSCDGVHGEALLDALDRRGYAVSSGSSCTSDTVDPSHVLVAMGVPPLGNVRVSLHRETTDSDVDGLLAVLPDTLDAVRSEVAGR